MSEYQQWQSVIAQKNQDIATLRARIGKLEQKLEATRRRAVTDSIRAKELSHALDEYDKSISQLYAEQPQRDKFFKQKIADISKQKDYLQEQFAPRESVYNDLYSKYRKCMEELGKLEAERKHLEDIMFEESENFLAMSDEYDQMVDKANKGLTSAKVELEMLRRAHNLRIAIRKEKVKRLELKIKEVEEELAKKTKENEELADICDRLIAQTGGGTLQ